MPGFGEQVVGESPPIPRGDTCKSTMPRPIDRGSHLPHEVPDAHAERVRDQLKRSQCHALLATFQPVEVDAIQTSQIRELVLRDPLRLPCRPDSLADRYLDVLQGLRLLAYAAWKHPA
jgi:hypothetical protein